MTSPEQDKIIEALAERHGSSKMLPLCGTDAVLACGCTAGTEATIGKWWYVPADPVAVPAGGGPADVPLRYAYEQEIADAHEQDAVRELLSAAGLQPVARVEMCECERFTAAECKASKTCSG